MATKSYKQLYEELKAQQAQPTQQITEEELFALKAVAYGCNTNHKLQIINGDAKFLERGEADKTVSFKDALITVYKLIERLSK